MARHATPLNRIPRVCRRFHAIREQLQWTQRDAGQHLNVCSSLIQRIERGQERPGWRVAFALRNEGFCLDWLYTERGPMLLSEPTPYSAGLFPLYRYSITPQQLHSIRAQLSLSQRRAATMFDTTAATWKRCESGQLEPKGTLLEALAERDVSINTLITGEGRLFRGMRFGSQIELALADSGEEGARRDVYTL
ncbi:helix-turn-helix domain-containing protein [Endozoicomonas sp. G2_2]|uniref:transcriptional regulator n=1 Tax=Endozoicomonas sp. G2_2 TaxID=2821092 RepID=UPI001ADB2913|nr:transcriptional regulator [Endozoicomonas sp. G2_2]MBO9471034.1 helix-turn-helix domain-containing protein [Endozoicomonas sp. G2_2]